MRLAFRPVPITRGLAWVALAACALAAIGRAEAQTKPLAWLPIKIGPAIDPETVPLEAAPRKPRATAASNKDKATKPAAPKEAPGKAIQKAIQPVPSKPQAILIENPSGNPEEPPYALTDQQGAVQRLVESTPSIDLAPYVGQIVRVGHDTGATLLASQLDLPLLPGSAESPAGLSASVNLAQHEAETLPPPVVLEEVVGQPEGPVNGPAIEGLKFPPSLQPSSPPYPSPPGLDDSCDTCVGCGGAIVGIGRRPALPGCGAACQCGYGRTGLDFSLDLLLLRTHDSSATNGGDDFEFGSRWEAGYNGTHGRRLAIRYFEYDSDLRIGSLDLEMFDLEFQRRFPIGQRGEWGVGGGLRWAEYDQRFGLAYSDTIGPMLGVYARAPAFRGVDGILTLRQSYQFGDAFSSGAPADRGTFGITELQFGLEHRRCTKYGDAFVRGLFETQYWDGVGTTFGASEGSRGLIGVGLGVGLQR